MWRLVPILIAALALAATPATTLAEAPASAPAATFHGGWTSSTFPAGCAMPDHPVAGNWNIVLLPDGRAAVHYTTFELGGHWSSVGGASLGELWQQDDGAVGAMFRVSTTAYGSTLSMRLTGETLEFLIAPFGPCDWGRAEGYLLH